MLNEKNTFAAQVTIIILRENPLPQKYIIKVKVLLLPLMAPHFPG